MNFEPHLQRAALLELYQEHARICRERKLALRPLAIQLFDSESLWGQFDSLTRVISISRKLIQNHSWQNVLGVFKHEMAHQYVFETNPEEHDRKPHGELFQIACRKIGVPSQFTHAKIGFQNAPLSWQEEPTGSTEERLLDKVKKLLALAQSTNEHEAALAMKKVQQIYAQYNLDRTPHSDRSEYVHSIIAEGKKRKNAWEQRVMSILIEHFFVEIIILQQFNPQTGEKNQAFEIIGSRENVLMAEYVYSFLIKQLELLCNKAQIRNRTQKSSYRLGILEGFAQKLTENSASTSATEINPIKKALVIFKSDPELPRYLKEIYPRLSFRKNSSRMVDMESFQAGQKQGQKLTLHKPIETCQKSGLFLGSQKRYSPS